jgi:hypothetical protein
VENFHSDLISIQLQAVGDVTYIVETMQFRRMTA